MAHQPDFLVLEEKKIQAEALLGHEIFGEAVRALRQHYFERIEACAAGDEARLRIEHLKLKMLAELVSQLQSFVNDYKFAAKRKEKAA